MIGGLVRWRLALRIARRDARRHLGRTLLVLLMVGLPVLAVVGANTLTATNDTTPVEALPTTLGAADARIDGASRERIYADPASGDVVAVDGAPADPAWTRDEVAALLPAGSRVAQSELGTLTYRTKLGYAPVSATADDLADPIRAGAATVLDGRFPAASGEVAISREIADRGLVVGDTLRLTRNDVPARVVGIVRVGASAGRPTLVLPFTDAGLLGDAQARFYVTVPGGLDWPAVKALNARGLVAISRHVVLDPPPPAAWAPASDVAAFSGPSSSSIAVLALVVVSVVLEVVLLAGPAFAVGVRRQRHDLALIAAAGGAPRDLRRVVLAGGLLLGGSAALAGAGLGIAAARLAVPVLESWRGSTFGPFDVPVRNVVLTVLVGLVAGLAAAYLPARQAASTDVVETLAGRRGQVRTTWRSPLLGLLLAAAGVVAVMLGARGNEVGVAAGAVLLVTGFVAAAPWLVGLLAPLARRLPTSGRLAVRDATRNRSRTAPAVAAVMATVAGVTALAIGSASDSAQARRDYLPQVPVGTATVQGDLDRQTWDGITALVTDRFPDLPVHRVLSVGSAGKAYQSLDVVSPGCSGTAEHCRWIPEGLDPQTRTGAPLVIADPGTVRALFPDAVSADVAAVVRAGRVAVLGDGALDASGAVRVEGTRYDTAGLGTPIGGVTLPATRIAVPSGQVLTLPSTVVIPTSEAGRLPASVVTSQLVIGGPGNSLSAAQEQDLREVLAAQAPSTSLYVERGWTDDLATPRLVLAVLGGVLVLVSTLTATGLALADARPDFATLAAIGAAPRTRRFVAMGSAAVVGGGGALLGVLVGLAPGIAVTWPLTTDSYGTGSADPVIVIPWLLLATVAVAVPLLAVAATGLVIRSRLPMARRIA
ncbi:MAG: FtsX-like permease family protein [Blastococcus sp.]